MTEPKRKRRAVKKEKQSETAKEREPEKNGEKKQIKESTVLVGQKPVRNYVIACLTHFGTGSGKIVVKARGRAICRAVDTVELLRRAFLKDVQLQGISICTEEIPREGGKKTKVSAVEIVLTKP